MITHVDDDRRVLGDGLHRVDTKHQRVPIDVCRVDDANEPETSTRGRPDLHPIAALERSDRAAEDDLGATQLWVGHTREVDRPDGDRLDPAPVALDGNRRRIGRSLSTERLVRLVGGTVAAVRPGDALDEPERPQALHAVPDGSGVSVDRIGDSTATDDGVAPLGQVHERRQDSLLTRTQRYLRHTQYMRCLMNKRLVINS